MTREARNKRINGFGNPVYDIYLDGRFSATVEVNAEWHGGLKVLLGAMQPIGKVRTLEVIAQLEGEA